MQWLVLRRAFPWRTGLLMCSIPALALAAVSGVVPVGIAAASTLLFDDLLGQF